ncbi:S8 family serine peptidase [Bacillus sp. CH30_1T]|uniref:S8 family serine peptidase n=1 Tax=Bacillus sp. CH30_1T TaxID=2604836 RepID=UPI0011F021B2|nr:S8 family serine peptidase [Bacillus sp. CH30_1T]KAA0566670.1 S8 family serine peptidase [Bacillus sp. CH30_1T]
MKSTTLKGVASAALSASLLMTPMSSMATGLDYLKKAPNDQTGISDVEGALKGLTEQQRLQFDNLYSDEASKLRISSDVNLNNDEDLDIIVQFQVDPAAVQVANEKAKGKSVSALRLEDAQEKVEKSHKEFKEKINQSKSAKKSKIKKEYKNAFNGVSMTLPAKEVLELIELQEVKAVWIDQEIQLDLPVDDKKDISPQMNDSIPFLGVDGLHDEGINGEGIKVGVLDTGIDYNHPDLEDVYKGGYDFVDNDDDPMEATHEEWKGLDPASWPETWNGSPYWTSHGTHVSGIIAGQGQNDSEHTITGVANGVDLYAYRVLGPYGSGSTGSVLAGIDKAVQDGMDVINLSLGATVNDPLYPTSVALNNAMIAGTVALVAAGNSGPNDYTVGSPGTSPLAITVGASDVSVSIPTAKGEMGEDSYNLQLMAKHFDDNIAELTNTSLEVVDAGLGYAEDFSGKDFSGKLALIERGTLSFNEKIANAKNAGASAVIIWNNVDGELSYYFGEGIDYIPAFTLTKEEGERLKGLLTEEKMFTFKEISEIKTEGDKLADFSSRGPSLKTYDIKPEITAPGVSILSTVPGYINDKENPSNYQYAYERLSGTSMATPYAAGVAAMILQNNPDYSPYDVKTALMNTADDLSEDYSVFEVGAGRVDPTNAVHSEVKLQVMDETISLDESFNEIVIDDITGAIAFGYHYKQKDSSTADGRTVELENDSDKKKDFNVNVELLSSDISGANNAETNGLVITVNDKVSVEANSKVEMTPSIEVPKEAEAGTYEGYIHFTNADNEHEKYQIPFSIIVADRGINYSVDRPAFASDASMYHAHMSVPATFLNVGLRSPMETMDLVVKDGDTGEYLGYLGWIDTEFLNEQLGVDFLVPFVFGSGAYYPFTGDEENPISEEMVLAPDGAYELEIIGTNEEGEMFKPSDYVFIDNQVPEITMEKEPGVYEIEYNKDDEQGISWFNGKIYDSNVDVMKEKGIKEIRNNLDGQLSPVDQGLNTVVGYDSKGWGFPTHYFTPEADGSFKFGVTPEEVANGQYVDFGFYGFDAATAGDQGKGMHKYYFIEKGGKYAKADLDKDELYLGDEVTVTLTMKNVEKLIGGEFKLSYQNSYYEFVDAQVNPEFKKFADEKKLSTRVEVGEIKHDLWENQIPVSAFLEGESLKGADGDMPILDVTFKVTNDEFYDYISSFNFTEAKYHKSGEEEVVQVPGFITDQLEIVPKHSVVWGYLGPEAFLHEEGWVNVDLHDKDVKITATSPDGTKYEGELIESSKSIFEIHGIPASEETYKVVVKVPGHFESHTTVTVGEEVNGDVLGVKERMYPGLQLAGDVDGDNIIDINDAIISVFSYGKEGVGVNKGDINQDGKVDETDLRFIEKNFLEKGQGAKKNKKPKEKHGKVTLEKLFRSVGLELNQ